MTTNTHRTYTHLLQDDLNLANDRLSHTMYRVVVTVNPSQHDSEEIDALTPATLHITLTSDFPDDTFYLIGCHDADTAVQAIWQVCALGLWLFSFDALPLTD